jgi:hypothetical protein
MTYAKAIYVDYCRSNIRSAIRFGIMISLIYLLIAIILLCVLNKTSQWNAEFNLLTWRLDIPEPFPDLFMQVSRQFSGITIAYLLSCMLLFLWGGVLMACLFEVYSLAIRFLLQKIGLQRRRDMEYFERHRASLSPVFSKIGFGLIAIAGFHMVVVYATSRNMRTVIFIGFLYIVLLAVTLFICQYFYDWYHIKATDPNLLKVVYGRRSSLGDFFYTLATLLFIVFIFRIGFPLLYLSANLMSERIFQNVAMHVLHSPAGIRVNEYLSTIGQGTLTNLFPKLEFFSTRSLYLHVVNSMKMNPVEIQKQVLSYLYWISMIVLGLSMLIPMVLYNWLFSSRQALKKALSASLISLIGGFGFQLVLGWLFLIPMPSIKSMTLVSMVIFTTYVNWIYRK